MNPGDLFQKSMAEIFGEPGEKTYDTWQKILQLLGCDSCFFKDAAEEAYAWEWFQNIIKKNDPGWLSLNRGRVLREWDAELEHYRNERQKELEKRKKKKKKKRKWFWSNKAK